MAKKNKGKSGGNGNNRLLVALLYSQVLLMGKIPKLNLSIKELKAQLRLAQLERDDDVPLALPTDPTMYDPPQIIIAALAGRGAGVEVIKATMKALIVQATIGDMKDPKDDMWVDSEDAFVAVAGQYADQFEDDVHANDTWYEQLGNFLAPGSLDPFGGNKSMTTVKPLSSLKNINLKSKSDGFYL